VDMPQRGGESKCGRRLVPLFSASRKLAVRVKLTADRCQLVVRLKHCFVASFHIETRATG
jgi:hypothetical protein